MDETEANKLRTTERRKLFYCKLDLNSWDFLDDYFSWDRSNRNMANLLRTCCSKHGTARVCAILAYTIKSRGNDPWLTSEVRAWAKSHAGDVKRLVLCHGHPESFLLTHESAVLNQAAQQMQAIEKSRQATR